MGKKANKTGTANLQIATNLVTAKFQCNIVVNLKLSADGLQNLSAVNILLRATKACSHSKNGSEDAIKIFSNLSICYSQGICNNNNNNYNCRDISLVSFSSANSVHKHRLEHLRTWLEAWVVLLENHIPHWWSERGMLERN